MTNCEDCNAKCCRYVAVELDKPTNNEDWDKIKWFLSHKNVIVYKDHEGDWILEFQTECKYLDENNRCKNYERRPEICRQHSTDECELSSDESPYKILFTCMEDVDDYLASKRIKLDNKKPLAVPA